MSRFTLGEIVVWLVLAAALGFVLGWLVREITHRSRSRPVEPVATPLQPEPEPDPDPEPEPEPDPEPAVEPGAYARSASPLPDGEAPAEAYVVKGKTTSMIYHAPGFPSYARTVADVWFASEDDAVAAGFRKPKNA